MAIKKGENPDTVEHKGLGLGSEDNQTIAVSYPNKLDHYIKEVLQIHEYARYMDDGYLIHESKEYLEYCLQEIRRICAELKIELNEKKTRIVKLSHGFTFLKNTNISDGHRKDFEKALQKSSCKADEKAGTPVPEAFSRRIIFRGYTVFVCFMAWLHGKETGTQNHSQYEPSV